MSVGSHGDKGRHPPPDAEVDERYGMVLSDRYRIGELLGTGGMGRVYAAEHVLMRKKLAVKVLHKELGLVPEVVTRFKREAMAAANIDHPNVASATDFGKLDDGSVFLVLEYVKGLSLREIIDAGPVPQPRVLHVARQIASALASAHALDIVHRDLKPENVMLVRKGYDPDFVKVLDFGIAKVPIQQLSERGSLRPGQQITKIGMVFGTPEYMAPEQALGQAVDGRADLYALGIIMFEMLAGVRPYASSSQVGILGQQLSMPVPRVAERAPGVEVGEAVEELLQELLNKESGLRPESARVVMDRLDLIIRVSSRAPSGMLSGAPEPAREGVAKRSVKSLLGVRPNKSRIAPGGPMGLPPPVSGAPRRVISPPPSKRPLPQPKPADGPWVAPPAPPALSDQVPVPPRVVPPALESPQAPGQPIANRPESALVPMPPASPTATGEEGGLAAGSGEAYSEIQDAGRGATRQSVPGDFAKPSSPGSASGESRASSGDQATDLEGVRFGDGERAPSTGGEAAPSPAQTALGNRLGLWGRSAQWVDATREAWPRPIRERLGRLPSSAILGGSVAVVALVFGGIVLSIASGEAPKKVPGPSPSAARALSYAPSAAPSSPQPAGSRVVVPPQQELRVPESELGRAKEQGASALEQLARRFPEDPAISVELAKAYRLEKRYPEVISQIRRLLELDSTMSRDAEVATLLWQSAQKQDSRDAAFELLQGPMGSRGADILFDLASTKGIRADVKAMAERYFDSPTFSQVASEALKIAVALKDAKTCEEKKELLPRSEQFGDRRALATLRTLEATAGCGQRAKDDCYPCLRGDGSLEKAIQAIDGRTHK